MIPVSIKTLMYMYMVGGYPQVRVSFGRGEGRANAPPFLNETIMTIEIYKDSRFW